MKLADLPAFVVRRLGPDYEQRASRAAPKRHPGKVDPFTRGFDLACMIRDGIDPTAPLIRERFNVSRAAAKRDRAKALRLARRNPPRTSGSGVIAPRLEVHPVLKPADRGVFVDTARQLNRRRR